MTEETQMSYPNVSQSWGIVGICLLAMLLFSPVNLLLNKIAGKEISFLVYYVLAMGATFWIAHRKRKHWTNVSGYNLDFSSAKIIILVSMAFIGIQTGIIAPIINLMPMPEFMRKIFSELGNQNGIFSFIAIVIAAPVLEELIFRGIILDGLLKIYSPLKSIIISSVLFGFIHLNPWQFVAAFIGGIFSGWVYYKTRKLTLSILIHFVNNLLAFGSMYFTDSQSMIDKPLTELYGSVLNFIMIILGAIIVAVVCLYLLRIEFKSIKSNYASMQQDV